MRTRVGAMIFAAVVLAVLGIFHVHRHRVAIELNYQWQTVHSKEKYLEEENRRLRVSWGELTRPERIESLARSMGLIWPEPTQVIRPGRAK